MSRKSANQIREAITKSMVDSINQGLPPWRKCWSSSQNSGAPCNFSSGRKYTGINPLILMLSSAVSNYDSKHWGSADAWLKHAGAHVKKGEHATPVTFFSFIDKKENGKIVKNKKGETLQIPLLKEFPVFNVGQVQSPSIETLLNGKSGIVRGMLGKAPQSKETSREELLEIAEKYLDANTVEQINGIKQLSKVAELISVSIDTRLNRYRVIISDLNNEPDFGPAEDFVSVVGVEVIHRGDKAFYQPVNDKITMPSKRSFISMADYYETLFHEMIHWGVRKVNDVHSAIKKSKRPYAYEELVAEIGACFLCMEIGIPMSNQMMEKSQSYVKSWLGQMENDSKYIFDAANHASKIADHLISMFRCERVAA